ncbi:MAG: hypothetical protein ABIK11_02570 [candidate division WOR-3 bacterium]
MSTETRSFVHPEGYSLVEPVVSIARRSSYACSLMPLSAHM